MSTHISVIPQLVAKARQENSDREEWSLFLDILTHFRKAMELYPNRSTTWYEYESERLVWADWFGPTDNTFPGTAPPRYDPPPKSNAAQHSGKPYNPFYIVQRDGTVHSRQSGTPFGEGIPSIESVLAGPKFRMEDGGIDFEAMRADELLTAQQLKELHEVLFEPAVGVEKGRDRSSDGGQGENLGSCDGKGAL